VDLFVRLQGILLDLNSNLGNSSVVEAAVLTGRRRIKVPEYTLWKAEGGVDGKQGAGRRGRRIAGLKSRRRQEPGRRSNTGQPVRAQAAGIPDQEFRRDAQDRGHPGCSSDYLYPDDDLHRV